MDAQVTEPDGQLDAKLVDEVEHKAVRLLREIKHFTKGTGDEVTIAREIRHKLEASLQLPMLASRYPLPRSRKYKAAVKILQAHLDDDVSTWGTLLGWLFIHNLGKVVDEVGFLQRSRSWVDEWLLGRIIAGALQDLGLGEGVAWRSVAVVKLLINQQRWFEIEAPRKKQAHRVLESWLKDGDVRGFLQVNRYRDVLWFNKESFDQLLGWMLLLAAVEISADPRRPADEVAQEIVACYDVVKKLQQAEEESGYQVAKLLEIAKG
jgi:hypothetical protein